MNGHPGGAEHSLRMLELSGLAPGCRVLDMGAGAGETVELLRSRGYEAVGIDIEPRGINVERGDMLHTGYASGSFDAVISQCACYVSGDVPGAFRESAKVLRSGGILMLSDVVYEPVVPAAEAAGFEILHREDMTAVWREYYIAAIWAGTADCRCGREKCGYELLVCRKK